MAGDAAIVRRVQAAKSGVDGRSPPRRGVPGRGGAVALEPTIRPIPWAAWLIGLACAAAAVVVVGALVYKHFTGAEIPGCHAGSACDQLDRHILGRVMLPSGLAAAARFDKWPTSFLGMAYYAAVTAAWLAAMRRITPGLRWIIRLGGVVSIVYLVVIVVSQKYCKYCIASHALNFALLACSEVGAMMSRRGGGAASNPSAGNRATRRSGLLSLGAFVLAFAGVSVGLGAEEHRVAMKADGERAASEQRMLEQIKQHEAAAQAAAAANVDDGVDFGPKGFTGRWRLGPEKAPVRVVMYGAYTCQFCKQMEGLANGLLAANPGKVSFCFKHYPMNSDCNPHITKADSPEEHRNACWAAKCAEACAIWGGASAALKGEDQWTGANEAFWKAHRWLFDIGGVFDDASLVKGLAEHGFDAAKITELMMKDPAGKPVVQDAEEGNALGLYQTPTIYINGVELFGWQVPGALNSAVNKLIAAGAPALDASNDRPILAGEKAVAEWRQNPVTAFAPDKTDRSLGKADAPVQVVVFGDSQEKNTAKADKIIRAWISGEGGAAPDAKSVRPVRYIYREFPGDQSCNPKLFKTFFEFGCMTARAAEAAGAVGGPSAYWKMHAWLMDHPKPMSLDVIKKAARTLGLDGDAVVTAMSTPEVAAAIKDDVDAGQAAGVNQIPMIYINGRFVKTWTREGDNVLERIADEAAGKK